MILKLFLMPLILPLLGGVTSDSWQVPLAGSIALVRPYLQPSSGYSAGHRGVDYQVSLGQSVYAAAAGTVVHAGKLAARSLVSLKHGAEIVSEVEPVCTSLKEGDQVSAGQQIGVVCQPETNYVQHCAKVRCLHFSVRSHGQYLSPLAFIGGLNPSRLLPYARG